MSLHNLYPVRINTHLFCRPLSTSSDNYLVFDSSSGKLFQMNSTSRQVYHFCDGKSSIYSIANRIYPQCDNSIQEKIANIIFDFEEQGWIKLQKRDIETTSYNPKKDLNKR